MKTPLASLPTEVVENIAFYYVCPRVLGSPVPLTALLLSCKDVYSKLSGAKHLYARTFKQKFSFSAIRRRGFEPRAGEWAWQLRWWCEVLKGVRRRLRRPGGAEYQDDPQAEEPGVEETMYALWLMCLEDDGCNRLQMQLAGVYEWVQGWIRNEMYRQLDKGWPIANAANTCAMWVFWYLTTKPRLMEESEREKESLIELVLPFLTVPFRYPSAFAPANHFRLPLRSAAPFTQFSTPTSHGPFPIYLHPARHTRMISHFDRCTPLCIPLAADAAKLVYFSRRETILFPVPSFYPRDRADHRQRVRARLAAEGNGQVGEVEVERVFRSELPKPTQEDFEELNAGLLGGDMVDASSSFPKGGGTPLPQAFDAWDDVRKALPAIDTFCSDLEAAERILGGEFDESACSSRRWDTDWSRLRLARSAWISTSDSDKQVGSSSQATEDVNVKVAGEDQAEVAAKKDTLIQDDVLKSDMRRSPTMLTGYPQKGAVYTPGALNGLWTGRMVIPSEFHLRALLVPQPDPNDPAALGPEGAPNLNFNDPNAPPAREAGHRPPNFNEDTLGLVAVPLYVRFTEYVVFSGGKTVPCANDTMVAHGDGDEGNASSSGSGSRSSSRDGGHDEEASYDQGMRDAWFPPNTTLALEGDRVVVSVPPGADNMRVRTEREEFVYIKAGKKGGCDDECESKDNARADCSIGSEAKARSQRQPGTFHDRDTCPGCLAREQALLATRSSGAAERGSEFKDQFISPGLDPNSGLVKLPPYVPSPQTIPPCNGIRDVLITGSTDPRHAAAWGKWVWKGRVRKWDGLVGLVRSADNGPPGSGTGGPGKIFFYGTLIGGRNFVGTWRLAHEDPRMPAYEGAFTLGRKDDE